MRKPFKFHVHMLYIHRTFLKDTQILMTLGVHWEGTPGEWGHRREGLYFSLYTLLNKYCFANTCYPTAEAK